MRQLSVPALAAVFLLAACGGNDQSGDAMAQDTMDTGMQSATAAPDTAPVLVAMIQSATDTGSVGGTVRVYAETGTGYATGEGMGEDMGEDTMGGSGMAPETTSARANAAMTPDSGGMGGGMAGGPGFRLAVDVNGLSQGQHAWHIHGGPCGQEAPVVVPFSSTADQSGIAQALSADQSGNATATVTVPAAELSLDQLENGQFSLHIHQRGGVDHGPTVACADLTRSGGM